MDDYVLRSDFEELKEAVKVDKRNLDVSWIILCSKFHFSRLFCHLPHPIAFQVPTCFLVLNEFPLCRQLPSSFSCSVDLRWYVSLFSFPIFMMTSPLSLAPLRPTYAFGTVIFYSPKWTFPSDVTTACISTPLLILLSGLPTVGGWHCASQECYQHPL